MTIPVEIPRTLPDDSPMNYNFLRSEGIKIIRKLGGKSWTDHNDHDPGITILEQLCYVITDLAYRLNYDIKDLLGDDEQAFNELFAPVDILTSNPVTLTDIRKLVIDVRGVRNAWVETVSEGENSLKGLYQVVVEKDDLIESGGNLVRKIKERLNSHRSLCEDFDEIKLLDKQKIRLSGTIEISDETEDVNELMAEILYQIRLHFSPQIRYESLGELLEKGKSVDEIFDGPVLDNGFIDSSELEKYVRKREIHASDIIKELMDIPNVLSVQTLTMISGSNNSKNWVFPLDSEKTPTLDDLATLDNLRLTTNRLGTSINKELVIELLDRKSLSSVNMKPISGYQNDVIQLQGRDRNIAHYYSLQNHFPANYGIGNSELPDSANELRKAQANQLRGYLTIFDQLLANYFSQTDNFKKLISFDGNMKRSYFRQSLKGAVNGLEDILVKNESYTDYVSGSQDYINEMQQRNRFLTHLLARFGERFGGYGMMLQNMTNDSSSYYEKLINDKSEFLKNYPALSANRGKGMDYLQTMNDRNSDSGFEKRIAAKIGMLKAFADKQNERPFYLIEHILLRPCPTDQLAMPEYFSKGSIAAFESATKKTTRCLSDDHNLKQGEKIRIFDNGSYQGTYEVLTVSELSFEIDAIYQVEGDNATACWQRIESDLRFLMLTESVNSFSAGSSDNTYCTVENSLSENDLVRVAGTMKYDGSYQISNVTNQGFEINVPFSSDDTNGRCYPETPPNDPYSLQMTFVLPEESKWFEDANYREFISNTIIEETPVHIRSYIKWFNEKDMILFKAAYEKFSEHMKQH